MELDLDTLPDTLRGRVGIRAGSVTFESTKRPWVWIAVCLVAGLVAAGAAYVAAFLLLVLLSAAFGEIVVAIGLPLMVVGLLPPLMLTMCSGVLGLWMTMTRRRMTVAGPKATYEGVFPPAAVPIGTLAVRGVPGRMIELIAGDEVLTRIVPSTNREGWTYDNVTWLAHRCAENAGVDLVDERPEAEWRRWADDTVYRAQVRFDVRMDDNHKDFPDHHAVTPVAPKHTVDVGGMQVVMSAGLFGSTVVEMDERTLRYDGKRVRLGDITRADVEFSRQDQDDVSHWEGALKIVVGDRIRTVARRPCKAAGGAGAAHLKWLAAEILRQAARARSASALGSEEDVPHDIAALVARTTSTAREG